MPRTHGYALKGQRCYGRHDWGACGRTNAIGALVGKKLLTISWPNVTECAKSEKQALYP